jgi:Tfp pilus assembly protein PilX
VACVEQALDGAQTLDLNERIAALALRVALGQGKAIAALPDAERVLGQAGVSLDSGDRQRHGLG